MAMVVGTCAGIPSRCKREGARVFGSPTGHPSKQSITPSWQIHGLTTASSDDDAILAAMGGVKSGETALLAIFSGRQLRVDLMRALGSVVVFLSAISVGVVVFYLFGSMVGIWG